MSQLSEAQQKAMDQAEADAAAAPVDSNEWILVDQPARETRKRHPITANRPLLPSIKPVPGRASKSRTRRGSVGNAKRAWQYVKGLVSTVRMTKTEVAEQQSLIAEHEAELEDTAGQTTGLDDDMGRVDDQEQQHDDYHDLFEEFNVNKDGGEDDYQYRKYVPESYAKDEEMWPGDDVEASTPAVVPESYAKDEEMWPGDDVEASTPAPPQAKPMAKPMPRSRGHDWKKHEWKKDDWKKDEWKKEEWKKDEWKKDEWKKDEWKKAEWQKDQRKAWQKDAWKKDEWKKAWQNDWKHGKQQAWRGCKSSSDAPWRHSASSTTSSEAAWPPSASSTGSLAAAWPPSASSTTSSADAKVEALQLELARIKVEGAERIVNSIGKLIG